VPIRRLGIAGPKVTPGGHCGPSTLERGTARADGVDMQSLRRRAQGHPLWYLAAGVVAAAALELAGLLIYSVLLPLTG
jgi:hypothetical protein